MPALDCQPAILVLADGTVFRGVSTGAQAHTSGEVVFNTAMTGYQEILTDPSYCRQIVTLTYPHIGNVGVNPEDTESGKVFAAGLVVRDVPIRASNFRQSQHLSAYLMDHGIPAISGIDTRKLTRILRDKGAQSGCLMSGKVDEAFALEQARAFPGLAGMDLAKVVSCKKPYQWSESEWALGKGYRTEQNSRYHVVAYDYGVKRNILRMLSGRGCKLTVLPAQSSAEDALALKPDGVFLSNGPGDPASMDREVEQIKELVSSKLPTFGICFGHQLLGRAFGGTTFKLVFGHRGGNQPVKDLQEGGVEITSHNHGFAVKADSLPADVEITHLNLNDRCVEGMRHKTLPIISVQYHPEAAPGPHDAAHHFKRFIALMEAGR